MGLGRLDVVKEPLPLRRQQHPPVGPLKQTAAQLLLEILYGPGHVGLITLEGLGPVGEAPRLGHGVEHPV